MLFTLYSNELSVIINSRGAELSSIKSADGDEYLWQADPNIWPRKAPILFPIVGKLKNNRFEFEQNNFDLPQHGFARDLEFQPLEQNSKQIGFELLSNEKTKNHYPFDFSLRVGYSLIRNALLCSFEVKNPGKIPLYFSLGAHPGFRTEYEGEKGEFPSLQFENGKAWVSRLSSGLLLEEKYRMVFPNNTLKLRPQLFNNDALVFEDEQIKKIRLNLNEKGKSVELLCPGWPYFGIWSKPSQENGMLKFVCLEPWHGVADLANHGGKIEQKRGIRFLEPGKSFETSYELRFY